MQLVEPVDAWLDPAGQLTQLLRSAEAPYFPAAHCAQLVAASFEYSPSTHALHFVAPVSAEYLPPLQKEQLVEPIAVWLEPAAQLVQPMAPEKLENLPAAHEMH